MFQKGNIYYWCQALDNISDDIIFENDRPVLPKKTDERLRIVEIISNFTNGKNLISESPDLSWAKRNKELLLEIDLDTKDEGSRTTAVVALLCENFKYVEFRESFRNFLATNQLLISDEKFNYVVEFVKKKEIYFHKSKKTLIIILILLYRRA